MSVRTTIVPEGDGCSTRALELIWETDLPPVQRLLCMSYTQANDLERAAELTGITTGEAAALTSILIKNGLLAELDEEPQAAVPQTRRRPIPLDVRRAVYRRDSYLCRHCGIGVDLTIDHRIPVSRGGTDDEDNLQTLCQPCNSRKGAR